MPDHIRYRTITTDDFPTALELRAAMVRELSGEDPDMTHPGWRRRYEEFYGSRMAADEAALFFADEGAETIGMAAVYLQVTHRTSIFSQPSAYVSNVFVDPAFRRRGIAAELMQRTIAWAKAKGCANVRLRTSSMGRPLYASLGFVQSEELELKL